MSWRELPILPLCRIYECLSTKDCLNASSCCKNWRYAFKFHRMKRQVLIFFYKLSHTTIFTLITYYAAFVFRDHLLLKVDCENFEKNLFLADTYNRNIKELEVLLASSIDEYSRFTNSVLNK